MAASLPASQTLGELARRVDGRLLRGGEREIRSIRPLDEAGEEDLSFLAEARHQERAQMSRAGALLVPEGVDVPGKAVIQVKDPRFALSQLLPLFYPAPTRPPGCHPTAVVGEGVTLDPTAHVGAYAVIGAGSTLGPRVVIHPGVVIGEGCTVGADVVLHPHAVLYDRTVLGAGTILHAGVVVGSDGFGYATHQGRHHKIQQVGRAVLEEDVEVGANAAIDRATFGETRIGAGSKIDNLVQVGHNVTTGKGCILCGQAGIAGSARLGNYVVFGGQAGSAGHLEVGDGVQAAARSAVLSEVAAGETVAGYPAIPIRRWHRQQALLGRLDDLRRRVRALEKAAKVIEAAGGETSEQR
jgi:UDP-3-O-[3-hydroxymyristoyl] glucosamine N-acyltransferase